MKKIPSLKSLLIRERDRKPQSWEQMEATARLWNTVLGGAVKSKEV